MAPGGREGDWACPNPDCLNHTNMVYASKLNCPKCGTSQYADRCGEAKPPGGGGDSMVPSVYSHSPRQVGGAHEPRGGGRPGDWHCSNPVCKNHTDNVVYGSKASCPLCGTEKSTTTESGGAYSNPYAGYEAACAAYAGYAGYGGAYSNPYAGMYGGTNPYGAYTGYNGTAPSLYQAQAQGVYSAQPSSIQGYGGGPSNRAGDWHCPQEGCKNHTFNVVFANKTHCPLCQSEKPEAPDMPPPPPSFASLYGGGFTSSIGGGGEDRRKSGGTRAGDWQCPSPDCKNHHNFVYGSKPSCSICGAANPYETAANSYGLSIAEDGSGRRERSRSPRRGGFSSFFDHLRAES